METPIEANGGMLGEVLDLEKDSPELEAELLKSASGPFKPLREDGLREIANQVLREYWAKQKP